MFQNLSKYRSFYQSSNSSHELDDAPDKPPVVFVTVVVLLSFLFVFAVIALSYPLTEKLIDRQENKVNMGMANQNRLNYLQKEKGLLNSSKQIDADHSQIPIDDAMKLTVEGQGDISKMSGTLSK